MGARERGSSVRVVRLVLTQLGSLRRRDGRPGGAAANLDEIPGGLRRRTRTDDTSLPRLAK